MQQQQVGLLDVLLDKKLSFSNGFEVVWERVVGCVTTRHTSSEVVGGRKVRRKLLVILVFA